MSGLVTLARPYAVAVFAVAKDGNLDKWSQVLDILNQVCQTAKVLQKLSNPIIPALDKYNMLVTTIGEDEIDKDDVGQHTGAQIKTFIKILATNKRLMLIPQIYSLFAHYKANLQQKIEVELETAYPLDKKQIEALQKELSQSYKRSVTIVEKVNADLIGGVIVRTGEHVLDKSLRGRLYKLAENLKIELPSGY